ncbi:MAG: formate dehydrogenase accessory sulfurtransferase FdhD [Desulfuromonadales bacterium]|jgi:FdhD protein|nr:formate dehydrogenase accessory sulfurtransferase FdhD [Desulfuromonadales bacterium]
MIDQTVVLPIIRVKGREHRQTEDTIVREIPMTLYFNKEEIVTVLCSPNQVKELMIGFLISEGFVRERDDIYTIGHHCEENIIRVEGKPRPDQKDVMNRRVMSSCCGKSRASFNFENDASLVKVQESQVKLNLEQAVYYANYLDQNSDLFKETGGIHNGGIGRSGEVLYTCYDIGRHNVLDKLLGRAYLLNLDLAGHVLFFSGRVSSEILLKVAKMNIPILVARSAPTDLALALAEDLNITVIGFARGDRLNIYTCPERIALPPQLTSVGIKKTG